MAKKRNPKVLPLHYWIRIICFLPRMGISRLVVYKLGILLSQLERYAFIENLSSRFQSLMRLPWFDKPEGSFFRNESPFYFSFIQLDITDLLAKIFLVSNQYGVM
ncbi:hypothetical protein NNL21_01005 [Paenibacillus mendelii]|nr:hypothetical protein [Paenibacillus mendelii]